MKPDLIERPWQPWERNFSGGRIGVQEQQGEHENWIILHVESGIGKTTTSLKLSEAWDLALMLSPQLKARLHELLCARRKGGGDAPSIHLGRRYRALAPKSGGRLGL
jgi:hypothetical protein